MSLYHTTFGNFVTRKGRGTLLLFVDVFIRVMTSLVVKAEDVRRHYYGKVALK